MTTVSCGRNADDRLCREYLKVAANQGSETEELQGEGMEEYILREVENLSNSTLHHSILLI